MLMLCCRAIKRIKSFSSAGRPRCMATFSVPLVRFCIDFAMHSRVKSMALKFYLQDVCIITRHFFFFAFIIFER